MYGWRGCIGLVVPCTNTTMESEFHLLAACIEGIAIATTRMHIEVAGKGLTTEALIDMEPAAMRYAIPELTHAGVDVIVYGCTSGSFVEGEGWDQRIIRKIQDMTTIPTTTASTAVVTALRELDIQRVALGTPYNEKITLLGKKFLEASGFTVTNSIAMDNLRTLGNESIGLAYRLGRKVDVKDSQCIFISCTKFPTIKAIQHLENDLRKPVISSNLASFWHALTILGIRTSVHGFGSLLEVVDR